MFSLRTNGLIRVIWRDTKFEIFSRNLISNGVWRYATIPAFSPLGDSEILVPAAPNVENLHNNKRFALSEIGRKVEEALGPTKWSMSEGLSSIFGGSCQLISHYTLHCVAEIKDHPLNYLAELFEADLRHRNNGGPNPFPLWRKLMVHLVADIFGSPPSCSLNTNLRRMQADRTDLIGKLVEAAYLTEEIHKRVLEFPSFDLAINHKHMKQLNRANKVIILIGDFLCAQTFGLAAAMKSQQASILMNDFYAKYCESEFFFGVDGIPKECSFDQWVSKTRYGIGSLITNTIMLMLHLNGHGVDIQKIASNLAILISLTYQAYEDIRFFTERSDFSNKGGIDLGMLPVVRLLELEPYLRKSPPYEIFERVVSSHAVIKYSCDRLRQLQEQTLEHLNKIEKQLRHEENHLNALLSCKLIKSFTSACSSELVFV